MDPWSDGGLMAPWSDDGGMAPWSDGGLMAPWSDGGLMAPWSDGGVMAPWGENTGPSSVRRGPFPCETYGEHDFCREHGQKWARVPRGLRAGFCGVSVAHFDHGC